MKLENRKKFSLQGRSNSETSLSSADVQMSKLVHRQECLCHQFWRSANNGRTGIIACSIIKRDFSVLAKRLRNLWGNFDFLANSSNIIALMRITDQQLFKFYQLKLSFWCYCEKVLVLFFIGGILLPISSFFLESKKS